MKLRPKEYIHYILLSAFGDDLKLEYRFAPPRRFRFDWAIPCFSLAVEYEGIMIGKSRHTTGTGYTNDARKYNIAALNGWIVLRYTALNFEELTSDLDTFLKKVQDELHKR